MYDAILFDLDGTLIDTESIAISTGLSAFAMHGLQIERAFLEQLIGIDGPSGDMILRKAFPSADLAARNRTHQAAFAAEIQSGLPLKPGAAALLEALHHPKAIVTSSGREGAHRKLKLAGVAGCFLHVVTRDDVKAPKPAPDPYLLAAMLCGTEPARCLVFEDSEPGAEAAFRAGCTVVQVPDIAPGSGRWAHHMAPDLLSGARMVGLV